jgi:hypothetical protein
MSSFDAPEDLLSRIDLVRDRTTRIRVRADRDGALKEVAALR